MRDRVKAFLNGFIDGFGFGFVWRWLRKASKKSSETITLAELRKTNLYKNVKNILTKE